MARLNLYKVAPSAEETQAKRLHESLSLSYAERWKKMFSLMQLAASLKKGPLKQPQGNGIVLKSSKWQ